MMRDQHLVLFSDFKDFAIFRYMGLVTNHGCFTEFVAHRRAIKVAEGMKSFNDHLEFTRRIGCPSEVATQLFRRLQTEGEPAFASRKYIHLPLVEDLSSKWKRLPTNLG
jgi:hypothetical protein